MRIYYRSWCCWQRARRSSQRTAQPVASCSTTEFAYLRNGRPDCGSAASRCPFPIWRSDRRWFRSTWAGNCLWMISLSRRRHFSGPGTWQNRIRAIRCCGPTGPGKRPPSVPLPTFTATVCGMTQPTDCSNCGTGAGTRSPRVTPRAKTGSSGRNRRWTSSSPVPMSCCCTGTTRKSCGWITMRLIQSGDIRVLPSGRPTRS